MLEERLAERLGQLAKVPGDGGLRERELFGGARHAAVAHARLEGHQLGKESVTEVAAALGAGHGVSPKRFVSQRSR